MKRGGKGEPPCFISPATAWSMEFFTPDLNILKNMPFFHTFVQTISRNGTFKTVWKDLAACNHSKKC